MLNLDESFLLLLLSASVPAQGMSFKSLKNLGKRYEKKIEHFTKILTS